MPSASSANNNAKLDASMQQVLALSRATTSISTGRDINRTDTQKDVQKNVLEKQDEKGKEQIAEREQTTEKYDNLEQSVQRNKQDSQKSEAKQQAGHDAQHKLATLGKESPAKLYQKAMADTTSGKNSQLQDPSKSAQAQAKQANQAADKAAQLTQAQLSRLQAAKTSKLPEAMMQKNKFEAFAGKQKQGPKHLNSSEQKKVVQYFKAKAQLQDNQAKLKQLQNQSKGKETQELKDKLLEQQGELAGEMAMLKGELQTENPKLGELLTKFESNEDSKETKSKDGKDSKKTDSKGAEKSEHLATKEGVDKTQKQGQQGEGQSGGEQSKQPDNPILKRAPDQLAVAVQQQTMTFSIGDTADGDPRTEFQRRQEEVMMQGHKACNRMCDGTAWMAGIVNDQEAFARVVRHQGERKRSYDDVPVQELQSDDDDVLVGMSDDNPVRKDIIRVTVPSKDGVGPGSSVAIGYWETQGAQNLNPDGSFSVKGPKGEVVATWSAGQLAKFRQSVFGVSMDRDRDRFMSPARLAQGDLPEIYSKDFMC